MPFKKCWNSLTISYMEVLKVKKYMYVGVLLGAIVLAGCGVNEELEKQVQVKEEITEDLTNGQAVEVETLPDTDKEKLCQ